MRGAWACFTTGREGPDTRTDDETDRHPTDSARPRAGHTPRSARGAYSLTPERSSSRRAAAARVSAACSRISACVVTMAVEMAQRWYVYCT